MILRILSYLWTLKSLRNSKQVSLYNNNNYAYLGLVESYVLLQLQNPANVIHQQKRRYINWESINQPTGIRIILLLPPISLTEAR
jgi:hypothetical protein